MTPAEQKAPDVDKKIETIRKALEGKYGQCSVNRGPIFAYFFVDKRPYLTLPKEFIEVLPLVDLEVTRGLVEHIADLVKDQKQYIKKCECRILELSDKLRKATENQPLEDKKEK